ncbi:MAG: SUMF1/EgtB/PvdO family nonheme iron enzyme, partial [Phycisphaerae bacterium]|nr:SUMF1/EgtB/PvdO family nonheme iron enzyme [Phycisphaerae bacterium]
MKRAIQIVCVAAIVSALGSAAMAVDIVTVPVGNVGNSADSTGYGAVSYEYNIGKYEVTAGQYRDFLNAVGKTTADTYGLYNSSMDSSSYGCQITWNSVSSTYDFSGVPSGTAADWENRPVNYVSFWDACRFANWLHNGQGAGDTETGAYTLTSGGMSANTITRNAGATWAVTSEDEWYKAAYYSGSGSTYYDYPTSSDTAPGYVNNSGNLSGTGTVFTDGVVDPGNYATYDG